MADRRMTLQARAARLGTSLDWGYRHGQALPYTMQRSPRPCRLAEQGLAHNSRQRPHRDV
jgi:hypothetical protein